MAAAAGLHNPELPKKNQKSKIKNQKSKIKNQKSYTMVGREGLRESLDLSLLCWSLSGGEILLQRFGLWIVVGTCRESFEIDGIDVLCGDPLFSA